MKGTYKSWTSLAAFLLVLLLAVMADGLMEALGPGWFMVVGLAVLGAAWGLVEVGERPEGGGANDQ